MSFLRYAFLAAIAGFSGLAQAQISANSLPEDTKWYVHADLEALRTANAGKPLYRWLEGEIFVEIYDELGIDLNEEANSVTAFSDLSRGTTIVIEGPIRKESRDKLLAMAAADANLDQLSHGKKSYYHVTDNGKVETGNHSLDDLQESAWFTFDVKNKVIITSDEGEMQAMLDNDGRLPGNHGSNGELFVLTADRSFVQAGARTDSLDDDGDDDWNSNILRNTEQVALLVAGRDDLIAVDAKLVSREPQMAKSLADIANGLVSLQALNSDLDPALREMLQNLHIEVNDRVLSVNVVVDPRRVVAMLDE